MSKTSRFFAAGAALGAALLLTDPSAAQQGPQGQRQGARQEQGERGRRDPQQFLDRRVARLTEGLSLSQQQAAQVRRILEEERTQMQTLRADRGEGRAQGQARPQNGERRGPPAEFVALRQRTEQRIEAVLSESQRAQYRQLREQRGERGERGDRGQRGEGRQDRGGRQTAGQTRTR